MDCPGATSAVAMTVTKQSRLSLDLLWCSVKFSNITLLLKVCILFCYVRQPANKQSDENAFNWKVTLYQRIRYNI